MRSSTGLVIFIVASILFLSAFSRGMPEELRINEIQVLGTHNSYSLIPDSKLLAHIEPMMQNIFKGFRQRMTPEQYEEWVEYHPHFDKLSFAESLSYDFSEGLYAQLDAGLRSLEIDVFRDPDGGRFIDPAGYQLMLSAGHPMNSLRPHDTTGLEEPGFKVLHMPDVDFRSSCNLFRSCLSQLKHWSQGNPGHAPIFILLEAKNSSGIPLPNGTQVLPFDEKAFDKLDAEIISVLGRDRVITPDDVRGDYSTLEQAVTAGGWPKLSDSRGKFLFLLLTAMTGDGLSEYVVDRPNLEGRVAFLRSEPGQSFAAFLLIDNAIVRFSDIQARVREGYLVRTRSDIETYEAKVNDTRRMKAAFASGAQIVSTDFYREPNLYSTPYVVKLPGDDDYRCNPVNASC